jgi:hypothetical protein
VAAGAASNTVGVTFVATAVGTGTGTAVALLTRRVSAQQVADLASTGPVDLAWDPVTRTLSSSAGADAVLTLASAVADGLMSSGDFVKLASIVVDRADLVVVPVRNTTGATIPKGVPVYVPTPGSGGTTILIAPADASQEATAANTIGLTADAIPHNSNGLVVRSGPLPGVNTAHLTEGALFWLSETTGATTSTRPTAPAHGVALGWCVKTGSGTSGILLVDVKNGAELDELHDVSVATATPGQALRLGVDGVWRGHTYAAGDVGADPAGTAAAAISAHAGAADPHPGYTTPTEAAAAAPVQSVSITPPSGWSVTGPTTGNVSLTLALPIGSTLVSAADRTAWDGASANALRWDGGSAGLVQVTARTSLGLAQVSWTGAYADLSGLPPLGTAAALNHGTAAGNLVRLDPTTGRLPAVDGSQLTNLPTGPGGGVSDGDKGDIVVSGGGTTWLIDSIVRANWDTAYTERLRWDGSATGLNAATGRASLNLGSAALAATADFATAAQGTLAASAIQPGNPALSDAREWSAPTIAQADAEAGTATDRRAWTAQRVRQAIEAWWQAATSALGKALATAPDAPAARALLDLGTLSTQSGTFSGTSSGTNTGDQTITLTGDVTGSGTASLTATLVNTAVSPASYGSAYQVAQFTVDSKGRLTSAGNVAIAAFNFPITLTASGGVYTVDVPNTNSRTLLLGTINGNVTILLANGTTPITTTTAANIPSGSEWWAELRFTWTSGTITWISPSNTGINRVLQTLDFGASGGPQLVSGKNYSVLLTHQVGSSVVTMWVTGVQP